METLSLLWLRRNLRLTDNKPLSVALKASDKILPIFIFDPELLKKFNHPYDRRLSFIASALCLINQQLQAFGGQIIILHGRPAEIMPALLKALHSKVVYADQDFEPENVQRDYLVDQQIKEFAQLQLLNDHLLIDPNIITNKSGEPYRVYTPYMKEFRKALSHELIAEQSCDLTNKLAKIDLSSLVQSGLKIVSTDSNSGPKDILSQIGYTHFDDALWKVSQARNQLATFINQRLSSYKDTRDSLANNSTSGISPYLRFGLISIRECYRRALNCEETMGSISWVNELIWREFYAMILHHFPDTPKQEFQTKYQGNIPWQKNPKILEKFLTGATGFPIIDAAIQQLIQDGWMHNRARMIVASFVTKNLFIDWRLGEKFFSQYLIDHEVASNVGGWQWAGSCGTDAQPYFRIFNPFFQGQRFDPHGTYVKKYLPVLANLPASIIHDQRSVEENFNGAADYPAPITSYSESRQKAIEIFRAIS